MGKGALGRVIGASLIGSALAISHSRGQRVAGEAGAEPALTVRPRRGGGKGRPGRPIRVFVLGLRGFPGVEGGVEAHAQNLYPRLADLGCDVEVAVRSPYINRDAPRAWRGVLFCRLWSPKVQGHEAAVHSLLAVLVAAVRRPDVVHIHAIGSAMWTPLARLLGLKVVVTHHSLNYEHEKWGRAARTLLRLGEYAGMKFSNARIAIARPIADLMPDRYGVEMRFIPNGVVLPELDGAAGELSRLGLEPGRYVVCVGRLTPEKRQLDLIDAFAAAGLPGWKLALVGATDATRFYSEKVLARAAKTAGVVCTGFQSGEALRQLYQHAAVFVLPSSHEGLSIAVLEALGFGIPVLASDIPGNLAIGLDPSCYFPVRDTEALAAKLRQIASRPAAPTERWARRAFVARHYSWDDAAARTLLVYREVVTGQPQLRLVPPESTSVGVA
jgi:glycosyltransferase involved in cell wall biosynthesis